MEMADYTQALFPTVRIGDQGEGNRVCHHHNCQIQLELVACMPHYAHCYMPWAASLGCCAASPLDETSFKFFELPQSTLLHYLAKSCMRHDKPAQLIIIACTEAQCVLTLHDLLDG